MSKHLFRTTRNHNRQGIRCYCSVEGCSGLAQSDSFCKRHYDFIRRKLEQEKLKKQASDRYQIKKQEIKEASKKWALANPEKRKKFRRTWKSKNKKKVSADVMLRHARKLKATPSWSNLKEIEEIYKKRPDGYHVDHIVPLRGKNVCGLHVPYNLQYLTAKDNMQKGNRDA